jgi:hypothetical protein
MSVSRVETAYATILDEFRAIVTPTYRTNPTILSVIRPASKIGENGEIGIELGDSDLEIIGWSEVAGALSPVLDEYVPVYVVGAVRGNIDTDGGGETIRGLANALGHDMERVAISLYTKYINDSTNPWNVVVSDTKPKLKLQRFLWLDQQRAYGNIQLVLNIHVRNMDPTLT